MVWGDTVATSEAQLRVPDFPPKRRNFVARTPVAGGGRQRFCVSQTVDFRRRLEIVPQLTSIFNDLFTIPPVVVNLSGSSGSALRDLNSHPYRE